MNCHNWLLLPTILAASTLIILFSGNFRFSKINPQKIKIVKENIESYLLHATFDTIFFLNNYFRGMKNHG
jgi:hypothetical protein